MINFMTNEGNTKCELRGSIIDLEADLCCLVRIMYETAESKDHELGEQFKDFVRCFLTEMPFADKQEITDKLDKKIDESKTMINNLKNINKKLEELNKMLEDMK